MSLRILVVDDDQQFRLALVKWFSKRKYLVEAASNAEEALEACAAGRFDGITLGEMIRLAGSLEAIPAMRKALPGVRILLITATENPVSAVLGSQPNALLHKPVSLKTIQEKMDDLLRG